VLIFGLTNLFFGCTYVRRADSAFLMSTRKTKWDCPKCTFTNELQPICICGEKRDNKKLKISPPSASAAAAVSAQSNPDAPTPAPAVRSSNLDADMLLGDVIYNGVPCRAGAVWYCKAILGDDDIRCNAPNAPGHDLCKSCGASAYEEWMCRCGEIENSRFTCKTKDCAGVAPLIGMPIYETVYEGTFRRSLVFVLT
jgi:hypothetical protein